MMTARYKGATLSDLTKGGTGRGPLHSPSPFSQILFTFTPRPVILDICRSPVLAVLLGCSFAFWWGTARELSGIDRVLDLPWCDDL